MTLKERIRTIAIISIRAEPEDLPIRGNATASGDDAIKEITSWDYCDLIADKKLPDGLRSI